MFSRSLFFFERNRGEFQLAGIALSSCGFRSTAGAPAANLCFQPAKNMETARLESALRLFDEAHGEDPRKIVVEGREVPWALHYHRRMSDWLNRLKPEAAEPLKLAARCQHIRRWTVPRTDYPEGRAGYRKWRQDLARFHREVAAKMLRRCGYEEATIERVGDLLLKKNLKTDPDTQTLEDVICLVFLENEFAEFSHKHPEEKLVTILRKTWAKMSDRGHREALRLAEGLPEEAGKLLNKALEANSRG